MIDSLPLIGRCFCKQISPFWLDNRDVQGRNEVRWRLGPRNKFHAPMCEPEVSQKQMYCFEKSAYDIVVTFWLPAAIRRPGNFAPLPLSLRLWCYSIKLGKFSENKKFSSPNVMNFYSMNICNFRTYSNTAWILHRLPTKLPAFHVSSCSFCVTTMPAPRVFFGENLCLFF